MAVIIKKNEKVEYVVNLLCDNFSNDEKTKDSHILAHKP